MKWKPDWSDIAENLLIGLMAVAAAAIFIVFCVLHMESRDNRKNHHHA